MHMGAQPGNKNAAYSDDERKTLKSLYIQHMQSGYNKTDFVPCRHETVESFFDSEAEKEELGQAIRANKFFWMQKYMGGCDGSNPAANMTGLIFAMKNKCGWRDKQDVEVSGGLSVTRVELPAKKEIGAPVDL